MLKLSTRSECRSTLPKVQDEEMDQETCDTEGVKPHVKISKQDLVHVGVGLNYQIVMMDA